MSGKLILITGGSRSGKSECAENIVRKLGKSCAYIATAEILDDEMRVRVDKHRDRRKDGFWLNYEAPFAAHEVMREISGAESILFDCVTIYMTNLLYGKEEVQDKESRLFAEMELLLSAARETGKNVVFVTNEVGSGIVPFSGMSREFRDLAGRVNQMLAKEVDQVYLVVCGIAVDLRRLAAGIEGEKL